MAVAELIMPCSAGLHPNLKCSGLGKGDTSGGGLGVRRAERVVRLAMSYIMRLAVPCPMHLQLLRGTPLAAGLAAAPTSIITTGARRCTTWTLCCLCHQVCMPYMVLSPHSIAAGSGDGRSTLTAQAIRQACKPSSSLHGHRHRAECQLTPVLLAHMWRSLRR